MNQALYEYITARRQRDLRVTVLPDLSEDYAARGLSPRARMSDRFVRLMEEPLKTKSIRAIAKEMGINEDAVAKYLKGVHVPRANKVIQIAEYFNVKPSWLLNGDD